MNIDRQRLKDLRIRKRLSQEQLAERSKLSKRQIQRLENGPPGTKTVHKNTADNLAKALGVESAILAGDLPIPQEGNARRHREADRVQTSAWIAPNARLAYDLIEKRYGVKATTIMNMAPLFFALLAEGSLSWRREMLHDLNEATDRMHKIGWAAGHLNYAHCVWRAEDGAYAEEQSINKTDIFGEHISDEAFEFGFDRSKQNPFADYLRKFVAGIDLGIVALDPDGDKDLGYGALENFPQYRICEAELDRITGGSRWARHALTAGHARLSEIPAELWQEAATEQRKKWLEDRVPEGDRIRFDDPAAMAIATQLATLSDDEKLILATRAEKAT